MSVNVLARFNSGELYGEWYRPFEIKYTCVQTYEYRLGTVVFKLRVLGTIVVIELSHETNIML